MFSSVAHLARANPFNAPHLQLVHDGLADLRSSPPGPTGQPRRPRNLAAAAVEEQYSCDYGSGRFFILCGLGGIISCGTTHTALVPLDLVKCRMQVDPQKYKGIFNGFSVTLKEDGVRGLAKGWAPTFIGYSLQGLCKFGFYEVFKVLYSNMLGEENTYLWRTSLYLAASASAEFFADIALAPMEAAKVRIQTQPGYANTLRDAAPKMYKEEGLKAFYKGVAPLWMRQIPYTMMKFACFERTVEALYKFVVPKPRSECSKPEQLVVTFVAGYIAGVFCAIVSHPADSVVSVLNKEKGSSASQVLKRLGFKGRMCFFLERKNSSFGYVAFFHLCFLFEPGVWKGLFARIIMIGTLTALQWFIYDSVKVYFRLPRPPPPEMPESLKKKLGLTQ
ncbi:phosphate carrier protein, mitochondrial isoform X1 [Cebus imitator]|uniref:phosphate carrier protein, mitochondrial isoform X1 n=1 Tax=Cebus imitator TaxID=2715852 RepID=UPI00080A3D5D|nr:phosphate carrier protein, mitochondrial isoform X1 [Cebus imitator]XP_017366291.1 phosphate carrier protein, mitochondrial isoform X1 [Cebus imitator]XP_037589910.1 phosphate carrier protein, mitochondrial isoform X1 [Cebus imitator]XP_037589914.1 phosphate carrier protein, mitochondrial isoform X1 [Cebus imitator]